MMKRVKRSLMRIVYVVAIPVLAITALAVITLAWLFAVDDLLLKLVKKDGTGSGDNVS